MYTLGMDIGGTFTDFALVDRESGTVTIDKEPTTPANPAEGALAGARRILDDEGVAFEDLGAAVHGTTLVSNILIEGTGARTGLLTTRGCATYSSSDGGRGTTCSTGTWSTPTRWCPASAGSNSTSG